MTQFEEHMIDILAAEEEDVVAVAIMWKGMGVLLSTWCKRKRRTPSRNYRAYRRAPVPKL